MTGWTTPSAWRLMWLIGLAAGCSAARWSDESSLAPGVTLPARYPDEEPAPARPAASAAGSAAATASTGPPRTGTLPDPKPLSLNRQWEYEVVYDRGTLRVAEVTERRFTQAVVTERRMGRYAIELWIGPELVDRVRFDFPMLAAEPVRDGPRRPIHEPPSLAAGALVERRVLVPASPRATRAVLVDRATGRVQTLPWPPDAPLPPPAPAPAERGGGDDPADAGPADTGLPEGGAVAD